LDSVNIYLIFFTSAVMKLLSVSKDKTRCKESCSLRNR